MDNQNAQTANRDSTRGPYFEAIVGVVITAVVLVLLLLLAIILRYMYQHKGTYHTNEAKGTEFAETADAALRRDPALQDAVDESKKEYFIWDHKQPFIRAI